MKKISIILTSFFVLIASSYSFERQVTAVWDATGDTLALDSLRYTTVSSVSSKHPVDYLIGNTLFNPTAASIDFSVYSYDGRNVSQGRLAPHSQYNLDLDKGVYFIQVDGRVYKWNGRPVDQSQTSRFLSTLSDSIAIAFKRGYKDKAILLESEQEKLEFLMERDSSTTWENLSSIVIEYDFGECEYYTNDTNDYSELIYDTIVKPISG
jgi:hypothetical protein